MANQIPTGTPSAKLSNGKFNAPYTFSRADLLQGFSDPDNDSLQVVLVTAENGDLTENKDSFTFIPQQNFNGTVSLDYIITDGKGAEINATQTFTVMAQNQIPTGSATAKLANSKLNSTYLLSNVNLLQGFSDPNNDALRISLITAENGEIRDNNNGTFTFSPDKDFTGKVTLEYVVSDDNGGEISATQTFEVVSDIPVLANQAPTGSASAKLADGKKNTTYLLTDVNLLQGISDANNDILRVTLITSENGEISDNNNGSFTFTPETDFTGSVSLDYVISDDNGGELAATQKFNIVSDDQPLPPVDPNPPVISTDLVTLTAKNPNFKGTGTNADNVQGSTIADSIVGVLGSDTLRGNSGDDTIDGGNDNDQLFGDADSDLLSGGDGNDSIDGGDDNDFLNGGNGNDTLDGGFGADEMTGGNGDDVYFVDNVGDQIIEITSPTGGKDTVNSQITWQQVDGIENIKLLGENDIDATGDNNSNTITGNLGNNRLTGNGGNDSLFGNEGNDILDGSAGADYLNGGTGDDVYIIDNSADIIEDDDGNDSVQSSKTISLVSYSTIENLDLIGDESIKGTGNQNDNILTGNAAENELKGAEGNDTLFGNDGDDTLNGGTGDNVLDGGNDEDTAVYNGHSENYRLAVADSVSVTNILTGEIDQLVDVEFVQFNDKTVPVIDTLQELFLTVSDVSIKEGNKKGGVVKANVVLTLDKVPTETVTVDVTTEEITATSGEDYKNFTQIVTFKANQKTQKISIEIKSDTLVEEDETLALVLSNPSEGLTLNNAEATITILNDDKPAISIQNAQVGEGEIGKFNAQVQVNLSSSSNVPVSVSYKTTNGTAKSPTDYTATSGNLTFAAGETSKTILVPIIDDKLVEASEQFRVTLSNPKNAVLTTGKSTATVTLLDNDKATTSKMIVVESAASQEIVNLNSAAKIQITGSASVSEQGELWHL